MPEPVSRYQGPLTDAMSMPAAFQSRSSAEYVPLLSARETNGGLRGGDRLQRGGDVLSAGDVRRIRLRSDQDEIVVHHRVALDAVAFREPFELGRLVVHEDDVGIAPPSDVERLAGADRHDVHGDPRVLLERGQQVAEQSRLLGRRRRRDDDERLRRVRSDR